MCSIEVLLRCALNKEDEQPTNESTTMRHMHLIRYKMLMPNILSAPILLQFYTYKIVMK